MHAPVEGFMKFLIFIFIISCATVHQELDPEIYYKRDMQIKIDGEKYEGVAVIPNTKENEIEFKSAGKLDLFTFSTCHREITQEEAHTFLNKKKVKLKYAPSSPDEFSGSCPIQVAGYDIKGKHSFAFMDIKTKDATLPATIYCNGKILKNVGVSICQTKYELIERIVFTTEVVVSPENAKKDFCKNIVFETTDNKSFKFKMPRRECVYNFMEIAEPHREHRLDTIGYEEIPLREL